MKVMKSRRLRLAAGVGVGFSLSVCGIVHNELRPHEVVTTTTDNGGQITVAQTNPPAPFSGTETGALLGGLAVMGITTVAPAYFKGRPPQSL